jgi:hypothetical protein
MLPMRFGALVLAAASLLACSTAGAQKPPAWMIEPPRDTAEFFYGTGEGPDPESARRSALRAVAARLRSAIKGQVTSTVSEINGRVDSRASVQTSEDTLKTEFSGVQLEASAKSPIGVYVLVKVDRPAFIRDTKAQIDVLAQPIGQAEAVLASGSVLEQFLALRRVDEQIDQALTLAQLLVGAGAEADGRQGVARFGKLRQTSQQIGTKLVFELRAPPADADVATEVAGFLADQGMRAATRATAGANVLTIQTQARQSEIFGDKLVKLVVRLSVVDELGRAVSNREHPVSGASKSDFAVARQAAVRSLGKKLREAGTLVALGLRE